VATIADRIRERRRALGLSLREVAGTGVSPSYVSRLEKGDRRPSAKALRTLAANLDVSAYWLATGDADPAEALARLVVEYRGRPLPAGARALARAVLERTHV
jgi:transcriptional regulator with XRE-family HTH domain